MRKLHLFVERPCALSSALRQDEFAFCVEIVNGLVGSWAWRLFLAVVEAFSLADN